MFNKSELSLIFDSVCNERKQLSRLQNCTRVTRNKEMYDDLEEKINELDKLANKIWKGGY